MLGIGLLALFGVGLAMSAGGGGDDDVEMDIVEDPVESEDEQIDPILVDDTLGDDFNYFPAPGTDPAIVAQVNDLVAELRVEPGLSVEDAVAEIEALIERLEAEADAAEPPVTEEPEDTPRPPTGGQFNDPLLNPTTPFVPTVPEEEEPVVTPAEPTATPEELVTVKTNTGSEFADSAVLQEGPNSGENADRDYIVSVSSVANEILVDYESLTTFLINYSDQTDTVTASLNSNIEGPAGIVDTSSSLQTDDDGTDYTFNSSTIDFRDSADITMNVTDEQIGEHVSEIDLTNPDDTLNFNFASDVTGNLHLVYNDNEVETGDDTFTTRTAYVFQTSSNITSLSPTNIALALGANGAVGSDIQLLAEIHLGEESLTIDGDPASRMEYTVTMTNFINTSPEITTNVDWSSVTEHDGTITTGTGTGGTDGGAGSRAPDEFDFGFNFPNFGI